MMSRARRTIALFLSICSSCGPLAAQKVSPAHPVARTTIRMAPSTRQSGSLTPAERQALLAIANAENRRATGPDTVTSLVEALSNASPRVRRAAVRALGRLERPEALPDIRNLLDDPDAQVRVEAANAVGQGLHGLRGAELAADVRRRTLDDAVDALMQAAERHREPQLLAVVAATLGRIPYADSIVPREVERVIAEMGNRAGAGARPLARSDAVVALGMMHAFYDLARASRATGSPSLASLAAMRTATTFGLDTPPAASPRTAPARSTSAPGSTRANSQGNAQGNAQAMVANRGAAAASASAAADEASARVRRLAYLALGASRDTSSEMARRAFRDPDEQVRRLAVVAALALSDAAVRRTIVVDALHDPSFLVRFEGVRSYRALGAPRPCGPLLRATTDANPHVQLAAIDALGGACDDRALAADSLLALIARQPTATAARTRGKTSWHVQAHALLALARIAPARAIPLLRRGAFDPLWQVRLYVARAALVARDTLTLSSLAFDGSGNVREAALAGISATLGHLADRDYANALASPDYQVVLQAAQALRGAPFPDSVVPSLFTALERISAERRENSRDPRVAIVERIGELGNARLAPRLAPFTTDFDSTVAARAATIMERWTLRRSAAAPKRLPLADDHVAQVVGSELRLLVRMAPSSGGGVFVVRLFADEAALTVARIVKLARTGYYAGLTFHRVEPAFVIQGGSPAATEYVGDGPFMRDEVGIPSHLRGTLGISTRGRDTGDAQLFVNLTDNFRLDHDYSVFGEIIQGREIAEGVIEGDVIERVDVVRAR
jgi:cyclophilin family peptidyl-prolyl cis-trans isomerase/HEAT repeat protein